MITLAEVNQDSICATVISGPPEPAGNPNDAYVLNISLNADMRADLDIGGSVMMKFMDNLRSSVLSIKFGI